MICDIINKYCLPPNRSHVDEELTGYKMLHLSVQTEKLP